MKDEVEALMLKETGPGRYSSETLKKNLVTVLESLKPGTELLED
jgi:hypothetical protein